MKLDTVLRAVAPVAIQEAMNVRKLTGPAPDDDLDPYEEPAEEDDDDEDEICSGCSGSGEGMYDGSTCYKCHGSGVEPGKREDDDG